MAAGYSGKPLAEKLGIKPGRKVLLVNEPGNYLALLGPATAGFSLYHDGEGPFDLIHVFAQDKAWLVEHIAPLKEGLAQNGALWVSWPKGSSGVQTDLTENIVRQLALEAGLVDTKVCAVDDTWSGLKLVIRLRDRKDS
ncbi:MAG: DUF3052 family protein [Chloroflexi bacterium]|nr:DUF3052 family protein [Chloroflexota bacterium]